MNPVRANFSYVYVIRSVKSGQFYTGYTSNLRKRLIEHNEGRSTYTKFRGPYQLIYYEACMNANDALAREKYLKTGTGKRYINNRIKRFLALTG